METLIKAAGRALLCGILLLVAGAGDAVSDRPTAAPGTCAPAEAPRRYDPRLAVSLNQIDDYPQKPALSRSADGRWAAWVTHCGDLARNRNIYTLWVYDLDAVRHALAGRVPVPAAAFALSREAWESEPGISELQWSPNGRRLTFLSRAGLSLDRIEALDLGSGETTILVDSLHRILAYRQVPAGIVYARAAMAVVAPQAPAAPQPERDGYVPAGELLPRYLGLMPPASSSSRGSGEIWLSPLDGSPRQLATIPESIDFAFPAISFSPDGRHAVAAIPPRVPIDNWRRYRVGSPNLQARLDAGTATQLHLFDLRTGAVRPLIDAPAGSMFGYSLIYDEAIWTADGKSVILRSSGLPLANAPTGEIEQRLRHPYVVEVEVPSLRVHPIARLPARSDTAGAADTELAPSAIFITRGGAEVSYERRRASGPFGVARFGKEAGRWRARAASGLRAGESDASLSIEVHQDYDHPPSVVATDRATDRTVQVQDLNPILRSLDIGRVTVFEWRDTRGRSWRGGLVHPPGQPAAGALPLVIQFYGFRESEFLADGPHTTAFAARSIAARNMLVLQVPRPPEFDVPDEGPSNLDMILAAIDALASRGLVDRARVGLVGFSATCYPVKYAIANAPNAFRAAVTADGRDMGLFEYILNYSETPRIGAFDAYFDAMFGGGPYTATGLDRWRELSPIFKASQVRAALLDQGSLRAAVLYGWEMHAALRRNHVPSEILNFPAGRHELVMPAERTLSMQATVDWMSFWLLGMEDLPTVPPSVLARWRSMREEQRAHHGADTHR